jgi:hypothetical protein
LESQNASVNPNDPPAARQESSRPSRRTAPLAILGVLLIGAAVIYIAVLQKRLSALEAESTKTIQAHLKTLLLQTQQVEALDRLADRVDKFNRELGASVGRVRINENLETNIEALEQKTHLPEDAKKTLDELEQSAAAVKEMAAKMKEYERYLGAPTVVKGGDSHSQIARRYLLEEAKLSQQEADGVLKRTALAWELEPGNQVFNLYHEGLLLSTVTQGTARRAPLLVQWAQRQAAAAKVQELEEKVRLLETKVADPAAPQ